jgi:uncharacterized protein (TIGR03083 family)
MSKAGLQGMQLATNEIIDVARTLSADEWQMPSAADGWSVQDVVAHAGNLLTVLVDAVNGRLDSGGLGIEALNDVQVARQRDRTPSQITDFLESQLAAALPVFVPLQDEPLASTEAQLLDLGSYPLHAITDMFTFDFTTHLHFDVLSPRGPISRKTKPLDEERLGPAISWLLAGIPRMQSDLPACLAGPLGLVLVGPAATSVTLSPADGAIVVAPMQEDSGPVVATLHSTTTDFLAWSTTRLSWRDLVRVDGDQEATARFLDALNLT